jgi:hypothetical protein
MSLDVILIHEITHHILCIWQFKNNYRYSCLTIKFVVYLVRINTGDERGTLSLSN